MNLNDYLEKLTINNYDYVRDIRKSYVYIPSYYESYLVRKLIGELTKNGNKQRATKFALKIIDNCMAAVSYSDVLDLQNKLEEQIILPYEFKPYRLGAYKYRIPVNISLDKARRQSYKRMFKLSLKHKLNTVVDKVTKEILDIVQNSTGLTLQKLTELKKLANVNKAYQYLIH